MIASSYSNIEQQFISNIEQQFISNLEQLWHLLLEYHLTGTIKEFKHGIKSRA